MTNGIEGAKREMYGQLHFVKLASTRGQEQRIEKFEGALDAHLEQLRQADEQLNITARQRFEDIQALELKNTDLTNMNSILTDAYQQQKDVNRTAFAENRDLNDELVGIQGQLARMTEERDALRNRVQVLEFANQAAGEALRDQGRMAATELHQRNCQHIYHLSSVGYVCTFCGVAK